MFDPAKIRKIAINTGGGDAPGLNAVIRAAGLSSLHNIRVVRHIDQIPTLGTGKTNYRALKELLGEAPG